MREWSKRAVLKTARSKGLVGSNPTSSAKSRSIEDSSILMSQDLQLTAIHREIAALHKKHGDSNYAAIYGTGCIKSPKLVLVFMNPTARNVSAHPEWRGLRAPWLGLKQTWRLFYEIGILEKSLFEVTQKLRPEEWTPEFTETVYKDIASKNIFTTNLAKATQSDARPLHDKVFIDSREGFLKELELLDATHVVTFGNQVSSILLGKSVKVSEYTDTDFEILETSDGSYKIYPCFYPVGRGWMNVKKVIPRIRRILEIADATK